MLLGTEFVLSIFITIFFFRVGRVLGGASKSYFNCSVSPYDDGYVLYLQYKV